MIITVASGVADDVTDSFGTADSRTYGASGDLAAIELAPGQCARAGIDDLSSLDASNAVDCEAAHATEVYARVEVPATGEQPITDVNRDDLANYGDNACYLVFEPYVGNAYDDSEYDYLPVIPSARAWSDGARTIHCVLYPYDADTTSGSAAGSGR